MPFITMPIAMGIAAIGSAGAAVASTVSSHKQNTKALEASERSDVRANASQREAEIRAETLAREQEVEAARRYDSEVAYRKQAYDAAMAENQRRWDGYINANQGGWSVGQSALQQLAGGMGFDASAFRQQMPVAGSQPGAPVAPPQSATLAQPPTGPQQGGLAALAAGGGLSGGGSQIAKAGDPGYRGTHYAPLQAPPNPAANGLQSLMGFMPYMQPHPASSLNM